MQVHHTALYSSDGRLRMEAWAIYAAFAPIDARNTLVKVGISQVPADRIYQVHTGSPFPVKRAIWMHVGNRSAAMRAERTAHRLMLQKRTRGEWFQFQLDEEADKRLFHDSMRVALIRATRKPPEWRQMDLASVIEAKSLKWAKRA